MEAIDRRARLCAFEQVAQRKACDGGRRRRRRATRGQDQREPGQQEGRGGSPRRERPQADDVVRSSSTLFCNRGARRRTTSPSVVSVVRCGTRTAPALPRARLARFLDGFWGQGPLGRPGITEAVRWNSFSANERIQPRPRRAARRGEAAVGQVGKRHRGRLGGVWTAGNRLCQPPCGAYRRLDRSPRVRAGVRGDLGNFCAHRETEDPGQAMTPSSCPA